MNRVLTIVFLFSCAALQAQMRYTRLVLQPKQKLAFEAQSDILVADTLILKDSAVIQLNNLRTENFIRTRVLRVEGTAFIMGGGAFGQPGRPGRPGASGQGPCQHGQNGQPGQNGLPGVSGVNLALYSDEVIIDKHLVINLSGGNGGSGGKGGRGGDGSTGTIHCNGGNGGNGGMGGKGGDGGNGGNFIFQGARALVLREWTGSKIIIRNDGGQPGSGGKGGLPGLGGPGPNRRYGRNGFTGPDGPAGLHGKPGTITFRTN
ncbi:MAG: hypothetical protein KatS3mg032_1436 [Cyclobacteriaceae bacterium]|nr:MAG: hypothetical protein KatS3mg032_1436 [Cyclobacteriaceae bacterium]